MVVNSRADKHILVFADHKKNTLQLKGEDDDVFSVTITGLFDGTIYRKVLFQPAGGFLEIFSGKKTFLSISRRLESSTIKSHPEFSASPTDSSADQRPAATVVVTARSL